MVVARKAYSGFRSVYTWAGALFAVVFGFIALLFLPSVRPSRQGGLMGPVGMVDYAQADFATPPADSGVPADSGGGADSGSDSGGSSDSGGDSGC